MTAGKDRPSRRALRLAGLGATVAGSYMGYLAQRLFLDADAREETLRSAHRKAARRMSDELGSLRGPAMKLGQALSLQTGVLPDDVLAELSALQMRAPAMHPSLVRAQFRTSMGADPEELFTQFDPTPFAAASLGQVHRAVTRAGDEVAVKIQYPGIRDAIVNDFKVFRVASKPAQLSKHLPRSLIDELEEQITAETDYRREASNLAYFAKSLAPLTFVSVPRVYPALSSDRVLTMSLLPGEHLDVFLARRPSQRVRDRVGEQLFELVYFQILNLGAFHADPHWGNYLFALDGGIGLVDFGCVKRLAPEFVAHLKEILLYAGDRESEEFARLLAQRYEQRGQRMPAPARRALVRLAESFYGVVYPPDRDKDDMTFDFGDAGSVRKYLDELANMVKAKGLLPDYVMIGRTETGLYQTLHRLRARVHTSRIVRRYVPSVAG